MTTPATEYSHSQMCRRWLGAALFPLLFSGSVGAKEPMPHVRVCSVYVAQKSAESTDSIGPRVALALKDRINASSMFRYVDSAIAADLKVSIISADLASWTQRGQGQTNALSVALFSGATNFLEHKLYVTPPNEIGSTADDIVATLDRDTSTEGFRDLWCK